MAADSTVKRQRTCVGCSAKSEKTEMKRIVRTAQSTVEFDPTGRRPGRGAYVCSAKCLRESLKTRRLERALKTAIGETDAERLVDQALKEFGEEVG